MYLVLARKYRPQRFEEIVGQEHVSSTLQNAVRNGRVAHAYLFCGSRGVGKTTMARVLAKALNCREGPTDRPCCRCEACRRIAGGDFIDVIEIDGASNRGINEIRELRQNVQYMPAESRFKIYYIDEVHMLTTEAFNALLKTLEEPPGHVKFIFSTTDPQQLPDTVKSRCQRFDFRRISDARIATHLQYICEQEGIELEGGALPVIARAARGSVRDAIGTLDQVAAFGEGGSGAVALADVLRIMGAVQQATLQEIVDALAVEDTGKALTEVHDLLFGGTDVLDLADQLSQYLRDLLVAHYCDPQDTILAGAAADSATLERQAELFSPNQLCYMIQLLREAKLRARRDTTGRIALEMAVIKMSRLSELTDLEEALQTLPAGTGAETQGRTETGASTTGGDNPAGAGVLRRLKGKLTNSPRTAEVEVPPAREKAPEGVASAKYRQMQKVAEDRTVVKELEQDHSLLSAFSTADKVLGLHPVRVSRREKPQENDVLQDEDVHEESEQGEPTPQ